MKPFVNTLCGSVFEKVDGNGNKIICRENTIVYRKPPPHVKIVYAYEFIEGISMTIREIKYIN